MISVIVPVYNAEAYVSRCLESILNQTYRDIRVVCVNDGSTDGTGAILEDFRRRDSRVEVLARENSGLSASRNAGLERADGEYVMFADADDWLDAHACADAVKAMRERDADIVFWSYVKEYESVSSPVLFWPEEHVFEGEAMAWLRTRLLGPGRRGTGPAGKDGFLRNGLGQALQAFPVPGCGVRVCGYRAHRFRGGCSLQSFPVRSGPEGRLYSFHVLPLPEDGFPGR